MGYLFPGYVWITYAGDFVSSDNSSLSCNSSQLESIVEGMFTIQPAPDSEALIASGPFADINTVG